MSRTGSWARGAGLLALVAGVAALAAVAAPVAESAKTRLQHCAAIALIPVVNTGPRTGYAAGATYEDCTVANWAYTLRLKNNAGNTLQENQGTSSYGATVLGTTVGCAGAVLHSFFYINAAGSGTSDTSATNSNCAY